MQAMSYIINLKFKELDSIFNPKRKTASLGTLELMTIR